MLISPFLSVKQSTASASARSRVVVIAGAVPANHGCQIEISYSAETNAEALFLRRRHSAARRPSTGCCINHVRNMFSFLPLPAGICLRPLAVLDSAEANCARSRTEEEEEQEQDALAPLCRGGAGGGGGDICMTKQRGERALRQEDSGRAGREWSSIRRAGSSRQTSQSRELAARLWRRAFISNFLP